MGASSGTGATDARWFVWRHATRVGRRRAVRTSPLGRRRGPADLGPRARRVSHHGTRLTPLDRRTAWDPTDDRPRPRARPRELGLAPGVLPPGPLDALTDVAGVRVAHVTLAQGDAVRTGVTAILPHVGDLFRDRVPAGLHVGNGFGKLVGATQLSELGELETPVLLTNTLSVAPCAEALISDARRAGQRGGPERQPGGGGDQRRCAQRHPRRHVTVAEPPRRSRLARAARRTPRPAATWGAGTRHRRLRLEGRYRHLVAAVAGRARRLDRGGARAGNYGGELRMDGLPVGQGARAVLPERRARPRRRRWQRDGGARDRRAALRPRPYALGGPRHGGHRAHRRRR